MDYLSDMTLKAFMEARDLRAATVSEKSGVPHNTLSRFLTGLGGLSAPNALRIVEFTGGLVTLSDLVEECEARKLERKAADAEARR